MIDKIQSKILSPELAGRSTAQRMLMVDSLWLEKGLTKSRQKLNDHCDKLKFVISSGLLKPDSNRDYQFTGSQGGKRRIGQPQLQPKKLIEESLALAKRNIVLPFVALIVTTA